MEAFGTLDGPTTLSDLGKAVNLPRATVRRTLLTLIDLGYVASNGRQFWLTTRVLDLASAYLLANRVSVIYQPLCDSLSRELDMSISVAVLAKPDVQYIATAHSNSPLLQETSVGFRIPAFCTSLGRVLLAHAEEDDVANILKTSVVQRTPLTITDKKQLLRLIGEARETGYSLVDQEANLGYRSVAVPICRYDGTVVAALSAGNRIELAEVNQLRDDVLPVLKAQVEAVRSQII